MVHPSASRNLCACSVLAVALPEESVLFDVSDRGDRVEFHATGHVHEASASAVGELGQLGAELRILVRDLGFTIPQGFVIGACDAAAISASGWLDEPRDALDRALDALEIASGAELGNPAAPLLLAARGQKRSLLWIGLGPANLGAVATMLGDVATATETLCTYLKEYASVILDADMAPFTANVAAAETLSGGDKHSHELLHILSQRHHDELGDRFPDSGLEQLKAAIAALAVDGPVVVQHMVLGVEGLASSRNLFDGQTLPVLADGLEPHRDELVPMLRAGEVALRDAVEFNVVASPAGLVVLNGGVALRSGVAAVRIAHALVSDPEVVLSREEAIGRINEHHIEQLLHHSFDDASALAVLATGIGASPGAATGVVAFSADEAVAFAAAGDQVILVAQETSPEDVHGMEVAAGILTSRGGLASHAAVVARGWGTPAVCGAEEVVIGDEMFIVGDTMVAKGDRISIDGSAGIVMLGEASTSSAEPPAEFEEILGWADEIRAGRLAVRANADTGADAAQARTFGAEGIGLCRTEHMFLAKDRLPIVRDMILATSPARERAALTRLRLAQRDDFLPILEAMDGLPVTVRLLDPPLHEFLPDLDELLVADAKGELDEAGAQLLAAARAWSEQNPMIGTRGVRLGWLKPGLYEMQVRALVEAVAERVAAGGDPVVEVMIPLTVSAPELAGARGWIDDALAGDGSEAGRITVGTMIETPRAALVAGSLASHADFFSFGTNDLTQLTYGFSRDDVETSIMGLYLENDLLPSNPFEHLDIEAVAELVNIGAERGRATKPGLKLGICGEHGGDPQSIAVCLAAGLDYVSCSPYRVPVARLAAAQAVISERSR